MTTATKTKYGFAIFSTPGLIGDGSFPLSADGVKAGDVRPAMIDGEFWSPAAVWETREAAEAAMLKLVPEGSTPGTWAGLSVKQIFAARPEFCYENAIVGMDGFVPQVWSC
jgi:hypothetical protein